MNLVPLGPGKPLFLKIRLTAFEIAERNCSAGLRKLRFSLRRILETELVAAG